MGYKESFSINLKQTARKLRAKRTSGKKIRQAQLKNLLSEKKSLEETINRLRINERRIAERGIITDYSKQINEANEKLKCINRLIERYGKII